MCSAARTFEVTECAVKRMQYVYLCVHLNERLTATNTTGCHYLKNRHMYDTCNKLHHLYITYLKHSPPRFQMSTNWNDASRTNDQIWIPLILATWRQRLCWHLCWNQIFRAFDVKMMWITARLTIFDTMTASCVQWYIKMYMQVLR